MFPRRRLIRSPRVRSMPPSPPTACSKASSSARLLTMPAPTEWSPPAAASLCRRRWPRTARSMPTTLCPGDRPLARLVAARPPRTAGRAVAQAALRQVRPPALRGRHLRPGLGRGLGAVPGAGPDRGRDLVGAKRAPWRVVRVEAQALQPPASGKPCFHIGNNSYETPMEGLQVVLVGAQPRAGAKP